MFDTDTTIVAVSTATGAAGRAILRASGDKALAVAETVFTSEAESLADLGGFRAVGGWIRCRGLALPARAYVFRAPRSYTRQDVVELHIPGHPLAANIVLEAMIDAGAERAEPGEFTLRAFLSGRVDLSEAEAVVDIIGASTDAQLRAAEANAAGALSGLCATWSETAAETLAEVEASIDMAEEHLELVAPVALADRLGALAEEITVAITHATRPPSTAEIPRVAMAGAPNAGKSSLLNALTGLDRAIVSAAPGATRDVLTAPLTLPGGSEVLLMDLAGLTSDAEHLVAVAADNAARTALAGADVVLVVVDIADDQAFPAEDIIADRAQETVLILANKADLIGEKHGGERVAAMAVRSRRPVLTASAVTGEGLDALRMRLAEMLALTTTRTASGVAMHDRQRRAAAEAAALLAGAADRAAALAHVSDEGEFLAIELRGALTELGTISGDTINEDLLGRIFRRFCVGK